MLARIDTHLVSVRQSQDAVALQKMPKFICTMCGLQYPEARKPQPLCLVCRDERRNVAWMGQKWTTLEQMTKDGYSNILREEEPRLVSITTKPDFGLAQRAFLVRTQNGNRIIRVNSFLPISTPAS